MKIKNQTSYYYIKLERVSGVKKHFMRIREEIFKKLKNG